MTTGNRRVAASQLALVVSLAGVLICSVPSSGAASMAPFHPQVTGSEDQLSEVTFHTADVHAILESSARALLRRGVLALWEEIEPFAAEHGLTQFPRSHVWGFGSKEAAARQSGERLSEWRLRYQGLAFPGRAYVVFGSPCVGTSPPSHCPNPSRTFFGNGDSSVVAHEAFHLVQYAIAGREGSKCLMEGAANWYAMSAFLGPEERPAVTGPANINLLPSLDQLHSRGGFLAVEDIHGAYALCQRAFQLLMDLEGGAEAGGRAYFNYLADLRRVGWRTAFDRSFTEDLALFEDRFEVLRESGFRDYRFESEIRRDASRQRVLELVAQCASGGERGSHVVGCS